jgi:hypothetical protein
MGAILVAVIVVVAGFVAAAFALDSLLGRGGVAGAAVLVLAESVAVFAAITKWRGSPRGRPDSN